MATRVGAATHAFELSQDESIGGRFHDRHHEARKRVASRDEGAGERSIRELLKTSGARAPAEDPIDLRGRICANTCRATAALSEHAQGRTNPACVDQRRCSRCGLQERSARYAHGTLFVEDVVIGEPAKEGVEVTELVAEHRLCGGVSIHEIEPKARP